MKLLGSFSFRLALLYAGLFTVSVSILMGLYYWTSIYRPMEAVRASLLDESGRMESVYRSQGADALKTVLERRGVTPASRRAYHALLASNGTVVTTNLPSWPDGANEPSWTDTGDVRWLRIEADIYRDGDEDDREALVLDRRFADGARLMLGRDVNDLDDVEEAVLDAVIWLPLALLLLTIGGGALMSRAIGRQLDSVSATARRVMTGTLSERIPLRGTGDDMDRLGGTLNAMLARIEESVESVRRVSDSVAHELRTPLARLQADLTELNEAPPERRSELIERATGEAERLGRMFDAVLRISRIEAHRHHAEMRNVDLSALLDDATDYHAPQADERGLSLETDIAPHLDLVGDRDLLFQAVSNLIDNAIKFTPSGGRVLVSARRDSGEIAIGVSDTGRGIPPGTEERLTERFFRGPHTGEVTGFGLGLSLVSAVVDLHGATLRFSDNRPGLTVEWRFRESRGPSPPP